MIVYLFGIILSALGVNVLLRSALGAGAWDTVTNNLSILASISLGTASALVNVVIMAFVVIYNKNAKFFLVSIPIVGIALAIDFWDIVVFSDFYPNLLWVRGLFYIGGLLVLTLGLAMMIVTKYPAMVFDELTLSLMRLFKSKSFFATRIGIELFAIVLATGFGFWAGIGFGAVNLGSLILALIIGPTIAFQLKWLNKWPQKAV